MKILYISSDNDICSGAFRSLAKLSYISKSTFKNKVTVVLPNKGDGAGLLNEKGIDNIMIRSENWIVPQKNIAFKTIIKKTIFSICNIYSIVRLRNYIKKNKFDIVHINTTYSYVAALAAKGLKVPVIWHLREALEEDQGNKIINRKLGYKLISESDKIVAISDFVFNKYKNIFGLKLVKINNGIDHNDFYIDREIFNNKTINILFLGGISKSKGVDLLINAAIKIIENGYKNIHVDVVGRSNEYAEKLQEYILEKNMSKYIVFHGSQQDTLKYYSTNDVLVMASKAEAFGRVTVEAMLAGCLVIGADSGNTPYILDNGKAGLLFKNRDEDDLYNKLIYVINNIDHCKQLAKEGQKYALNNFTAHKNASEINELYQQVLEDRNTL